MISSTPAWFEMESRRSALLRLFGSATATSPPGLVTRRISAIAAAGIGQVDQHRLAGRQIERVVGEGEALRLALLVREPPGEPEGGRAGARLLDPARLALDARDTHVARA